MGILSSVSGFSETSGVGLSNIQEVEQSICSLDKRFGALKVDKKLCNSYTDAFFKELMGYSFEKDSADVMDEWVYDFFLAIEEGDDELLQERVDELKAGSPENQRLLLCVAQAMGRRIGRETGIQLPLDLKIPESFDKQLEKSYPLLATKEEEKNDLEKTGPSLIWRVMKVAVCVLALAATVKLAVSLSRANISVGCQGEQCLLLQKSSEVVKSSESPFWSNFFNDKCPPREDQCPLFEVKEAVPVVPLSDPEITPVIRELEVGDCKQSYWLQNLGLTCEDYQNSTLKTKTFADRERYCMSSFGLEFGHNEKRDVLVPLADGSMQKMETLQADGERYVCSDKGFGFYGKTPLVTMPPLNSTECPTGYYLDVLLTPGTGYPHPHAWTRLTNCTSGEKESFGFWPKDLLGYSGLLWGTKCSGEVKSPDPFEFRVKEGAGGIYDYKYDLTKGQFLGAKDFVINGDLPKYSSWSTNCFDFVNKLLSAVNITDSYSVKSTWLGLGMDSSKFHPAAKVTLLPTKNDA